MIDAETNGDWAAFARRLLRRRGRAALATNMRGAPYVSLVLLVADLDASPLLLLSDLAQHSRNIAFDPRISLLVEAGEGRSDPLTEPRLSLIGQAEALADPRRLERFTAHHPASAVYSGFADFRLYRMIVDRGHLVAGFGQIHWVEGGDVVFARDLTALAEAEPDILRHINEDFAGRIANYARELPGRPGANCRATGIDPEGLDLRCGDETARLDFPVAAFTPEAARAALVQLGEKARK